MKPAPLTLHRPGSLAEAVELLGSLPDAKVLGGGQSLIPAMAMRLATPAHLVDLTAITASDAESAALRQVVCADEAVRVGALVTHARLASDAAAAEAQPLLRAALRWVAHPAIRNRGTTVGSIVHADPSGEMPAIAALTDAVIHLRSPRGTREAPVAGFIRGAMEADIAADEIATGVDFGRFGPAWRTAFTEYARRSGDYALAGVGVAVEVTGDGIGGARAAFVSVTDGVGALDLAPVLGGLAAADLDAAADAVRDAVAAHVDPVDDIHASADYRRHLAGVLTVRALRDALGQPARPAAERTAG